MASAAQPLIALYAGADRSLGDSALARDARIELARAVDHAEPPAADRRRHRLWSATDWTTPWLTAYAGGVLLDARDAGIAVDDSVLARLGDYLTRSLTQNQPVVGPVSRWYASGQRAPERPRAAVDFLSRAGLRDRAAENELLRLAAQLAWEDRVRLAARARARRRSRRGALAARADVALGARRGPHGDAACRSARRDFYFDSRIRPAAYLLGATLAVDPAHPLVGPLVETLVAQGRGHVVGVEHAGLRHRGRGAGCASSGGSRRQARAAYG